MQTRFGKTLAVAFLCCGLSISQFYAQGVSSVADADEGDDAPTKGFAERMLGTLITPANYVVQINNEDVMTGATIFSGSKLRTPQVVGTRVQLGQIGSIDFASSTEGLLTFDKERIGVDLKSGCVTLTTAKSIDGSVKVSETEVRHTNPAEDSFIFVCAENRRVEPAPVFMAPTGFHMWSVLPFAGATTAVFLTPKGEGENPSPMRPGG